MLSKKFIMSNKRRKLNGMILTGSALAGLASATANTTSASLGELFNALKGSVTSGLKVSKDGAKNLVNKLKKKSNTLILFIKSLSAAVSNSITQYIKSAMEKETLEDIKNEMLNLCTDPDNSYYKSNIEILFKDLDKSHKNNIKIFYNILKRKHALGEFVKILNRKDSEFGFRSAEIIHELIVNKYFDETFAGNLSEFFKNENRINLLVELHYAITARVGYVSYYYRSIHNVTEFKKYARDRLFSLIKSFDINSLEIIVKHYHTYANKHDDKTSLFALLKHENFSKVAEKLKLVISSNRPDGSDRLLSMISSGQLKLDSFFLLLQEEEFNSWAANGLLSVIENEKNSSYIADLLNSVFGEGKGKFAKLLAKISKRCTESNDDTLLFNFLKIIDKLGTSKNLYQFGVSFQMLNENALYNFARILERQLDDTQLDNFIQLFFLEEKNLDFLNFVGKERFNKNAVKKFASWLKVAGKEELKNFLCFITCASSDTMSSFLEKLKKPDFNNK